MRTSRVLLSSLGQVSLLIATASCVALSTASCAADPAVGDDDATASTPSEQALARVQAIQERFQVRTTRAEPRATKGAPRFRPVIGPAAASGFEPGTTGSLQASLAEPSRVAARAAQVALPRLANGQTTLEDAASHMRVAFALRGAAATPVSVAGGYALYPRAYEGADVIHRVTGEGTEDFVLFEDKPAHESLAYDVDVSQVAGLRLVGNALEMLDAAGTPTLRVAAPYVVDAKGAVHQARLSVAGCAYDANPAAPWGRAVTSPGASSCTVQVGWANVAYPALVDPSWTTTGTMTFYRHGVAATRLASGQVLFTGGNLYASLAAEIYDPATGVFASTAPMTLTRAWHTAALLPSGKVLVAGGAYQEDASGWDYDYTTTTELFDPATGLFTAGPALPDTHATGTALASGDVVFIGGMSGASAVYRAASNTFTATGAPNVARAYPSMTLLASGKVLLAGGSDTYWGNGVATAEIFDPAANAGVGAFTATGSMSLVRYGHRTTALPSGLALVSGGYGGGPANQPRQTEIFDPAGNGGIGAFTAGPTMLYDRSYHSATLLDSGRILIAGCNYNDGKLSWYANNEELDVVAGSVVQSVSPFVFSEQHVATKLASGNVLLAVGSTTAGYQQGRAAVYDPNGTPPPPPPPACTAPGAPTSLTAASLSRAVRLNWAASVSPSGGFRVYRKSGTVFNLRASVGASARTYTDTGLTRNAYYTYQTTAWSDCNGNGVFDTGDLESAASNQATARAN